MAQIKKDTSLRKAILQAAITGQLISSCHSEQQPCHSELDSESAETGKELLDKIIVERNKKLIAEWEEAKKTNPKAKKPAPIVASFQYDQDGRLLSEVEAPFEIPENWCWCRLGEIGDWGAGATPNRSKKEYYSNEGIPWIKTGELNNGIVTTSEEFITEKALKECSLRYNKIGDVMIAMYGATIGKVAIAGIELTTNQACCACTTFDGVYNKYLFYFLMANKENFIKQGEGGAQPNISREKIVKTLIPLPPLSVQKATVAKLEQVLPLVDAYENALLQKEELKNALPDKVKKAILQEAITGQLTEAWRKSASIKENGKQLLDRIIAEWEEAKKTNPKANKPAPIVASLQYDQDGRLLSEVEAPFEVPENWCWCRLGDLVTILGDGLHGTPKFDVSGEYYFVNGNNLNNGVIEIKPDTKKVNKTEFEKYKKELNDSTIFVSINGTIGNIAFYNNEKIILGKSACYFNVAIQELKKYFFYLFQTDFFLTYAIDNATGTTIKNVGLGTMRNFLLPLPPLAEQEEIVRKVEELLAECTGLGK